MFAADLKRVNEYALPASGALSQLNIYLEAGSVSGEQTMEGVLYADSNGAPGRLLGVTSPSTYASTQPAGWYKLVFPAAVELPAGNYWIGVLTGSTWGVAGYRYDTLAGAKAYNVNRFASGPSDPFGSFSRKSEQLSLYATYTPTVTSPPTNTSPPTITGTVQQGQRLTERQGSWGDEPTSFQYQWLQCDALGNGCLPIAGATTRTYWPVAGDVGHTLRVVETASNAAGTGSPAVSAQTAVVLPPAPSNISPPTISGTAQQGQTLTELHGSWSNEPTAFAIQWLQCDGAGNNCTTISGAIYQSYTLLAGDVGHTLRVQETASNEGGAGSPATSSATAPVSPPSTATFGKTSVGASQDAGMFANYKIAHKAVLSAPGSVTKLSVYAIPGINSPSPQALRAVIYADEGGAPGALVATGSEVTYRGDVNGIGWFDLPLPAPVALAPGTYWIGFITGATSEGMGYAYDKVAASRAYDVNPYASGPSNPFGAASSDAEQASVYATYVPSGGIERPHNTSPPTLSGPAQQGQALNASPGSWTPAPTSFAYAWQRCDAAGANCNPIPGAASPGYMLTEADVGRTVRVSVTAANEGGSSAPVSSSPSAVVGASGPGPSHVEYVLQDGLVSVYDMDHEYRPIKTFSLPQTKAEVRGVTVAPASHLMFIPFGGDGPMNGSGNGSVLAYDLVSEKVVWEVHLPTGIDSGQVSPDGSKLYIPTGEETASGIWNVLSAANGELLSTIQGGSGAHNTVVSNDGRYVYLGGRFYNYLEVYETATGLVKKVGPLIGTVRPLTANGKNTLAFTTATGFDGFQVSSVTTGNVLFTVSFGAVPPGFPYTAPSHGISLSPDEKTLYVLDTPKKLVQFYDVSGVSEGVAPTQIGTVAVSGLSGQESPCTYDCGRGGWLQLSRDGRFLFVGDSGEVIEVATRKVIATLPTLAQTKKSIEVDWQGGVPVATSGRTGVGYVE